MGQDFPVAGAPGTPWVPSGQRLAASTHPIIPGRAAKEHQGQLQPQASGTSLGTGTVRGQAGPLAHGSGSGSDLVRGPGVRHSPRMARQGCENGLKARLGCQPADGGHSLDQGGTWWSTAQAQLQNRCKTAEVEA